MTFVNLQFIAGVNYPGKKFTAGVIDTGDKLLTSVIVSTTRAVKLQT